MSVVFGVFVADGAPIRSEDLAAMAAAAPAPGSVWQDRGIALFGPALTRHDPTGVVIAARIRLDNREELSQDPQAQDVGLVLDAYLKWGERFAERLLGDFAIAVWDPRDRKLLLVRDHHGATPLYFHSSGSLTVFSSSMSAVLAHTSVPRRPDLFRLSQLLATWPSEGSRTAYEDISRVPAGHMLVTGTGVKRYWELDFQRRLTFQSDEEAAAALLEVYSKAVACRLPPLKPVGVTLSGGLDSGSVTALAARELSATQRRLIAFTSVPRQPTDLFGPNVLGDESPMVEAYRQTTPNLDIVYDHAEDISPLAGIDRCLALIHEPVHAASNLYWMVALTRAAQSRQVATLLTGQMGNFSVSMKIPGLRASSRERLLLAWARPVRNLVRKLSARGAEPWLVSSPLNPEFVRRTRLGRRRREAGRDPNFQAPSDREEIRRELLRLSLQMTASSWNEMGAAYGMEVLDPTADKRVLEFCAAVPIEQLYAQGLNRSLLRRAMAGIMPPEVVLSRRRGRQAADLGYRLLASQAEISAALAEMEGHPLAADMLDLPKMRRVLTDLNTTIDGASTDAAGTILMRGLMVGRFLQRF